MGEAVDAAVDRRAQRGAAEDAAPLPARRPSATWRIGPARSLALAQSRRRVVASRGRALSTARGRRRSPRQRATAQPAPFGFRASAARDDTSRSSRTQAMPDQYWRSPRAPGIAVPLRRACRKSDHRERHPRAQPTGKPMANTGAEAVSTSRRNFAAQTVFHKRFASSSPVLRVGLWRLTPGARRADRSAVARADDRRVRKPGAGRPAASPATACRARTAVAQTPPALKPVSRLARRRPRRRTLSQARPCCRRRGLPEMAYAIGDKRDVRACRPAEADRVAHRGGSDRRVSDIEGAIEGVLFSAAVRRRSAAAPKAARVPKALRCCA